MTDFLIYTIYLGMITFAVGGAFTLITMYWSKHPTAWFVIGSMIGLVFGLIMLPTIM